MTVHKETFISLLDRNRVSDRREDLLEYGRDWTRQQAPDPCLILFPKTSDEVQKIVSYCCEHNIKIVPSGGRTGLAAAAVAANQEVVVSFQKMDHIISVDIESGSIDVEAGAILENVQKTAAENGMFFPMDFAARGSCQIGGCISTNAGGLKVIKYGMMRDLVLGIEVVTPAGGILHLNSNLHKNNSGYDLKQFFIGAEGTLGLITKATLKIVPKPKNLQLALMATDNFAAILEILKSAKLKSLDITAFEFFTKPCLQAVLNHAHNCRNPFAEIYPLYVMLEIDCGDRADDLQYFAESVEPLILDGALSLNHQTFRELWAYRENIPETIPKLGQVHKNDIAVPISSMPSFIMKLEKMVSEKYSAFQVLLFGHIGDGNIHVNIIDKTRMPMAEFTKITDELDMEMCRLIKSCQGSISAEHGIGLLKKKLMHLHRNPEEIQMMKHIKSVFDPKNICNPGKIIDL
ncbi:FAD-binding oxidoreductase [bacterium]|nr:FAD-binding oxidoreductase [bacterium]